jgi:arylformamidase
MQPIIDPKKHKVIDIAATVIPGMDTDRPFAIQRALLADNTFRFDILKTHSHVGSHVEVASHYFDGGKSITDYPLELFYGPGCLLSVKELVTDAAYIDKQIGGVCKPGDIIVCRNDSPWPMTKEMLYHLEKRAELPTFSLDAAQWFVDHRAKMLVLDYIRMGDTIENVRAWHDVIFRTDCTLVEIVVNLDAITKPRFFVMALPYKVEGLDSSFTRPIVIEEK